MSRPKTIQGKITAVVLAASGTALLVATVALLLDQYVSHREETANRLRIIARIVAAQSSAAVVFKDSRAAEELLSSLRAEGDLVAAAIYTKEGSLFVRYLRPGAPTGDLPSRPRENDSGFHDGIFELYEPIIVDQKPIGIFYLRSDLQRLHSRMAWNVGIAMFVLAAATLVAILLASRLVSLVIGPILRLERMAHRVTEQRDYTVRAPEESADEIGRLVHAFNEMLAQIQLRDDALRKAQADLEERVQARTRALQDALRELESFTYTISHDLRAPLRAMSGFSRMFLEDYGSTLDPAGHQYFVRILEGAKKMDALIQDLLEYSRLTRQELKIEPIDMDALAAEVLRQMDAELKERKAEVVIEGSLPRVMGHALTLNQTLTNLLSNGIKFMAKGVEPRIRVRARRQDGLVRIEVEDNGIGIAPEYQERIFRIFERLNASEVYPGTGIGLAIVRRAMERMGGRSGVESKLGQGSRFWIELPAVRDDAAPARAP